MKRKHAGQIEIPLPGAIGFPNGERGKIHRTRDEARGELRGDEEQK